jgi:hypothetical protein
MIRKTCVAGMIVCASALFFSGCELIRGTRQSMAREPANSIVLNGAFARLATIAWADLHQVRRSGSLTRAAAGGSSTPLGLVRADSGSEPSDAGEESIDNPLREIRECFQRMDSYDFSIEVLSDRYRVHVTPVQERCVMGDVQLYGGAATYVISRDFEILERGYEE